ncbi:MAG: replication factor C large subunit [Nanoarchaeota archaeon]
MNINFVEKYRAKSYIDFVGQEKAIQEIKQFLSEFPKKKGLIIHGPAGTGKTSLVIAAAKENHLDILELNSSDLRNKQKLELTLKPAAQQASLFKKGKIILMDEVDGVTGTDIGGIAELVRVLDLTAHPIIMTCNDVWQTKLAPIRSMCKRIEMKPLTILTIKDVLQKIAEKEGIKRDSLFYHQLAIKSQGDLRAALNDLHSYAHLESLPVDTTEKRDVEDNIFNILKQLFKERKDFLNLFDSTRLSLDEVLLWIEENIPKEYKNESLAKAYHALGNADVFRGRIYKKQSWRFLLYQNIFQSAGISYSKSSPLQGFTKYEPPKRILKIWQYNQKMEKKKTISKKVAHVTHTSSKRIMKDFPLIKLIIQNSLIQKQLQFSDQEMDYLKNGA